MAQVCNVSQYGLVIAEETTFCVLAPGPGIQFPVTSGVPVHDKGTVQSAEIRPDRQRGAFVQVSESGSASLPFELVFGDYDDAFQGLFGNDINTIDLNAATDISVTAPATIASTVTDFTSIGGNSILANSWVVFRGFANAGNNVAMYVTAVTANSLTIDPAVNGITLVTEAAGASVDLDSNCIRNGTQDRSYSLEAQFNDQPLFAQFLGFVFSQLDLQITTEQIITGTWAMLGAQQVNPETAVAVYPTPTAKTGNSPMAGGVSVGHLAVNGVPATVGIRELNLSFANNVRIDRVINQSKPFCVSQTAFGATGTLSTFCEQNLYQNFLDHDRISLQVGVFDDAGNQIMIDIPRLVLTEAPREAGGVDDPIIVNYGIGAEPTLGAASHTAQVCFLPAA